MNTKDLGFHDGSFDGFWLSGDGTLHIFLNDLTKTKASVAVAKGVFMIRAGEFKAGSIVLSASVQDSEDIDLADMAFICESDPDGPKVDLSETLQELEAARRRELLQKIRSAGLKLIEISPSYGGYLTAIARQIDVLSRRDWLGAYGDSFGSGA
jgi:hypothetical protein